MSESETRRAMLDEYRKLEGLVVRYIAHVIAVEGDDFIDHMSYSSAPLTNDERAALTMLADKARETSGE